MTIAGTDIIETTEFIAPSARTMSWPAVFAGGVAASAVALLLIVFGVGVGLSSVSPWADQGVSAGTFKIATGIYLIVVAMISSTIGGFIAGRMRDSWTNAHVDEVYFRDTAHGFMSWAFATLLSVTVLGAAGTHLVSSAITGAVPAAGAAAASSSPSDATVDALLRATPANAAVSATDPARQRAEIGRIMAPVLTGGELSADDRTYVAQVISARTGLSQAEAEQRVSAAVQKAKVAADDARKAAAKFALWLAASQLAGALAASLAATEGGVLRDSRWYEPGWRKGQARY